MKQNPFSSDIDEFDVSLLFINSLFFFTFFRFKFHSLVMLICLLYDVGNYFLIPSKQNPGLYNKTTGVLKLKKIYDLHFLAALRMSFNQCFSSKINQLIITICQLFKQSNTKMQHYFNNFHNKSVNKTTICSDKVKV